MRSGPSGASARRRPYEAGLIGGCEALARREPEGRDCSALAGEGGEGLRFVRTDRRFVVYAEIGDEVVTLDVVHGRADLPRRLKALRG